MLDCKNGCFPTQFTFFVAVCFTLNYTIGSGFLTLPWAFYESGIVLGAMTLITMSSVALCAVYLCLETLARANALACLEKTLGDEWSASEQNVVTSAAGLISYGSLIRSTSALENSNTGVQSIISESNVGAINTNRNDDDAGDVGEENDIPSIGGNSYQSGGNSLYSRESEQLLVSGKFKLPIGKKRFELPEMCAMFLGDFGKEAYLILFAIYAFGTMWAYSVVFANAWATVYPLYPSSYADSYQTYLLIWACVEVPWSLMELDEQISVQITLTFGRVFLVLIMVITVLAADLSGQDCFDLNSDGNKSSGGTWKYFDITNLYVIIPLCAYANNMHHSISTLVSPFEDKRRCGEMFTVAFLISFSAYLILAIVLATYFGQYTETSSNLNWQDYVGFLGRLSDDIPAYAVVISVYVVLFPSLDVGSTYPLMAVTFGNNFCSYFLNREQMRKSGYEVFIRSCFRCFASIPPIIGAFVITDLGSITAYTGLTGIVISLFFPAALSYYSRRKLEALGIQSETEFTRWWSRPMALFLMGFSLVALVYILASFIFIAVPEAVE